MRKTNRSVWIATMLGVLVAVPRIARAQGSFEVITGKAFDSALPKDFYLEGNAIPTEKRNAALLKTPAGARLLIALIDTTGYSSQIQQKYIGMVINEGRVTVCQKLLSVGSYGFGIQKPGAAADADAKFLLYDQAGAKAAECTAKKDAQLKQPKPLQVLVGQGGGASLYLGRYRVEFK